MKYTPETDEVPEAPYGPVWAVILTILFFFIAQIAAGILLVVYALIFDGQTIDTLRHTKGLLSSTQYQFVGNIMLSVALFGLISGFLKLRKSNLRFIGLRKFDYKKLFTLGVPALVAYYGSLIAVSVVLGAIWPDLFRQQQDIGFSRMATGLQLLPIFISLVVVPPLIEETLCRGFLFSGLRTRLSFAASAAITSLVFALPHLQGGNHTPLVWAAAIDTFILSMVLCWLRERTGSIWVGVALHAVKNGIAFVGIFLLR